jgi:hypothetical protein
MGLLPIEWAISIDFTSAGMLAAKAGGFGRGPEGASHPWREAPPGPRISQYPFHPLDWEKRQNNKGINPDRGD